MEGAVVISSDEFVARVPDGYLRSGCSCHQRSRQQRPAGESRGSDVTNPAIDTEGTYYVTLARPAGPGLFVQNRHQLYGELSRQYATSIAIDREGQLYVSSRHDGTVYGSRKTERCPPSPEGMGVATGIAFDREQNLYVGRSGTIFKIAATAK